MKDDYLFGAVYIIEQDYSDEEIIRDLTLMKDMQFNLVTLWPVANPWLSNSTTDYVFTQTRKVMDLCDKMGMKVILQLFGQNQAQEFMSDSLLTDDMMIHDEEGEHVNYNCFWANLNHPVVRELMDKYFEKAIKELKGHPALLGWDVFNEAHFRSDDKYTVKLYQEWLKKKYKDINILNKEWYRRYETFSQITPDKRRSSYSIWSSILPDVEYERFRSENLTDICKFLYDTAKKYDDVHPIIIDGTSSQILSGSVIGRNNDEFDTAYIPDIYGATFYPKSWGKNYKETPWIMSMYYTIPSSAAKKANKPYYVNELQTHTQSVLTPGSEVTPQELVSWTWMCIFTGASGMQLWRWRPFLHGYQSTGRGLTRIDGTPNKRGEAVADLVRLLQDNKNIFTDFKAAEPVVRIGVSYNSRLFYDSFNKWSRNNWPDSVAGWYRAFWDLGLPVEFADLDKLDDTEMNTPVMVLPSIIRMPQETAQWLEKYVENGGILIADARLGVVNEWGVVPSEGIPGKTLTNLFGVRELDVNSNGSFILDGERINANFMYQQLELGETAKAVAAMEDGTPAVVINHYGRGKTIYFNSFIGVEMSAGVPGGMKKLITDEIINSHGSVCYAEKNERVHISFIQAGNKKLMLVINFSDNDENITLFNLKPGTVIRNLADGSRKTAEKETLFNIPADKAEIFEWEDTAK